MKQIIHEATNEHIKGVLLNPEQDDPKQVILPKLDVIQANPNGTHLSMAIFDHEVEDRELVDVITAFHMVRILEFPDLYEQWYGKMVFVVPYTINLMVDNLVEYRDDSRKLCNGSYVRICNRLRKKWFCIKRIKESPNLREVLHSRTSNLIPISEKPIWIALYLASRMLDDHQQVAILDPIRGSALFRACHQAHQYSYKIKRDGESCRLVNKQAYFKEKLGHFLLLAWDEVPEGHPEGSMAWIRLPFDTYLHYNGRYHILISESNKTNQFFIDLYEYTEDGYQFTDRIYEGRIQNLVSHYRLSCILEQKIHVPLN